MMEECIPMRMFSDFQEVMRSVRHILDPLQEEGSQQENTMGRPCLVIEEQLSFFVGNGFKVEDMALMLGCSKRTIERRLSTYNLSIRNHTVRNYRS